MSVKPTSVWGGAASHKVQKPHVVADIHFAKAGSSVLCACDWQASGRTAAEIERAFYLHRKEMGLNASLITIRFAPPSENTLLTGVGDEG